MKFSYNWLKQLTDFKQTPEELAHLINVHITEVEEVETEGTGKYTGVIVAEILEIKPHPNADKLKLPVLDIGRGRKIQVVCGASNIEVGQKIAFAPVGAVLPGGKMEAVTIRGVESLGMVCSESELEGSSAKSKGILVLDKNASVGRPVQEYSSTNANKILDLKILSNRPDYLSYIGIAREIATVLDKDWVNPLDFKYPKDTAVDTATHVSLKVDKKLCTKYIAHYVENIEVRESPEWLQGKLIQSGLRPINNIVDISNLVMLELGQPIHAFAYDKVEGNEIQVRKAKDGETIQTLGGETRKLNSDVLVIADKEKPIALAGLMGSEDSGVSDETQAIIVEIATFDPPTVRRGSKTLGLATDASIRFERGLQPALTEIALKRTLSLINEVIPDARIAGSSLVDEVPEPKRETLKINTDQITNLLGTKIPPKEIEKILTRLDFKVKLDGKQLIITPPILRCDIKEAADVAEEVLRIWGVDKVESTMPIVSMMPAVPNKKYEGINAIKDYMAQLGFSETPSHSFIAPEWANKLGLGLVDDLKLKNPLHSHWTHLVPA
ncbi:MAG: phenylalanine--tRNA ligase subunit beta, partial [Patescibacteria group bacterium]|nr:phenylalanine--tRNA ligase subunit beta [Patescibacteria group bacterium]